MTLTIAEKKYTLPDSVMEVTLGQRVQFEATHGAELREKLDAVLKMKGPAQEEALEEYDLLCACKTLSFFGNIPMRIVDESDLSHVLTLYNYLLRPYSEDIDFAHKEVELNHHFHWENEEWELALPELNDESVMSYGEFLDAKQWVKNTWEQESEKWKATLGVACVFFRKKGEAYHPDLRKENGERYNLLQKLPLGFAIHIGFFFHDSMISCQRTFPYSNRIPVAASVRWN